MQGVEIMNNNFATATILTTSAKQILKHYNEQIVNIKARGGSYGTNKVIIDDNYGISINNPGSTYMSIQYKQKRDEGGNILNLLSEGKVEEICKDIDARFDSYYNEKEDVKYLPDLAVESFEIEVTDDKLRKLSSANTNVFDILFVSDIVEDDNLKEKVKNKNSDYGLYKMQGFKFRALNMHQIIETVEKYGQVKKQYIQEWNGINDVHPKAPIKIAQHIATNYLPKNYGDISFLKVKGMNRVVLTPVGE